MGLTNSAPESKDRRGMYIVRGNFLGGFGDFQKMERKNESRESRDLGNKKKI